MPSGSDGAKSAPQFVRFFPAPTWFEWTAGKEIDLTRRHPKSE